MSEPTPTDACPDVAAVLRDGGDAARAALDAHAQACAACREALEPWIAIEAAAPFLRRAWDSPLLWPRIARALEMEVRARRRAQTWRLAAAAAVFLALAAGSAVLVSHRTGPATVATDDAEHRRLLTERALSDVEGAEAAYIRSIETLSKVAEARLASPASPTLASYREKLVVLDAAIAECRAQIAGNRYNAHLRRELLSIYQEKQRTLEQVLKEETDAS